MNILPAGSKAPDFTLHSTPDQTVSLSEFRGRNVILALRALFVIGGDGVIRWSYLSPMDVNPGADGILKALEGVGAAKAKAG